jgi:hypothetical protein
MGDLFAEEVPPMPPISMAAIEELGEGLRAELLPYLDASGTDLEGALAADGPAALDVLYLVEHVLQRYGIDVYPASVLELGDREAATFPDSTGRTTILIREDSWEQLMAGGRQANRARATVMHELAHAVLHVQVLRARARDGLPGTALNRVSRRELKAFCDPEWQAWALAGAILLPRRSIESMLSRGLTEQDIADTFGVSASMLRSHIKRLKMKTW